MHGKHPDSKVIISFKRVRLISVLLRHSWKSRFFHRLVSGALPFEKMLARKLDCVMVATLCVISNRCKDCKPSQLMHKHMDYYCHLFFANARVESLQEPKSKIGNSLLLFKLCGNRTHTHLYVSKATHFCLQA